MKNKKTRAEHSSRPHFCFDRQKTYLTHNSCFTKGGGYKYEQFCYEYANGL